MSSQASGVDNRPLKVLHLSTYDANGGAGRAAYAIHSALQESKVLSRMRVAQSAYSDPSIIPNDKYPFMLAKEADRRLWSLQRSTINTWRSPARFGSITAREINASAADIVHLHWVTDGFMSVETIGAIKKPIVWSLCDAWAFSGAEHYATDFSSRRFKEGYTRENRSEGDSGFDLDRWTWERKRKNWKIPMHLIPASTWLTTALKESALLGQWPSTRLPHIVNTEVFRPRSQMEARLRLGFASDQPLALFLASGGIHDHRKGWDLLLEALRSKGINQSITVVIVGPKPDLVEQVKLESETQHSFVYFGEAHSDNELSDLYSSADLTAVPSREDNMPITAMESQSCGTPVVAFDIGGLSDIVRHRSTGYLASPEDTEGLAKGINWILQRNLRDAARDHAFKTWSGEEIVPQLLNIYREVHSHAS